jgi:putative component of toxin-antitoxin plasmid stabilization module
VIDVREYLAADVSSPYAKWFNVLNAPAAAKVAIAITRMAQGNLSNTKSVGGGIQDIASTSALGIESIWAVTVSAL